MAISISNQVQAANSKLAIFLRNKEEEEALLQIGKRKPKKQITNDEHLPGGRARWSMPTDFKSPTPMVDRPRTVNGATSFHFSYITISKKAVPMVNGRPIEGKFGKTKNAALDHSKYIERDGAAEISQGAEHAAYVERPEVVESIDPSALLRELIERNLADVINEKPTADEAAVLGVQEEIRDGIPSVFSNISHDPFEREEYWRAVERCERNPQSHQIILKPDNNPEWWIEVQATDELDPAFKNHALLVAEQHCQWLANQEKSDEPLKPFQASPFTVSAERAGKLIEQMRGMHSFNEDDAPFKFKSGRGGRIQIRFVAELPHELTAEDRAIIVQNFCDHIGGLKERKLPDGTVEKVGMMYTAVIHAPDAHNDRRNYHLHVVAHDRPAKWLEEHGMWDFEVQEHYIDLGSRKERTRYPYRQNKIGEVQRVNEDKSNQKTAGVNFIPTLRRKFADINNAVLRARGIQRRLDPRKYTEMGIDRTPTEHLGTKAAALEAIGVNTAVGRLNAIAIWNDAERAIVRQARDANKAYADAQKQLDQVARTATAANAGNPLLGAFRQLMSERAAIIADVADDRKLILTFDHMEAKAKSRAIRTRQTCLQFLSDIERGKADHTTRIMKRVIQDRWKSAQAHIELINQALAPHRAALAEAARDIEARERRLREIDKALEPIRAQLEAGVGMRPVQQDAGKVETAKPGIAPADPVTSPTPPAAPVAPEAIEPAAAKPTPHSIEERASDNVRGADAGDSRPKTEAEREAETEQETPAVPVEPVAIEGTPIVEPTIAPRQDQPAEEVAVSHDTPEGLEPLRPAETLTREIGEPEVVRADITQDGPEASKEVEAAANGPKVPANETDAPAPSPVAPEADVPAAANDEPQAAKEPKVDGRTKPVDPALFDLPEQAPPVKPGTSKAEYSAWDQLMNRIANDRIPIHNYTTKSGKLGFTVPALGEEDQKLLAIPRLAARTEGRLASINEKQHNELDRLTRWIRTIGKDPTMLILEGRTASLGAKVKPGVRTMMKHWGSHPQIGDALREENARRIELAKAAELDAKRPVPVVDHDLEARRSEAARIYPTPDQAFTPLVADFITLLRNCAPEQELQAAADKIYADRRASEDINRHTVELATAFRTYSEGFDHPTAQRARNDRLGRG